MQIKEYRAFAGWLTCEGAIRGNSLDPQRGIFLSAEPAPRQPGRRDSAALPILGTGIVKSLTENVVFMP
ncbi:hypothetical protein JYP51_02155 [Ponticoccus gilvus]|nr:hypothetical protein [Enemella evansiae]